MEFFDFQIRAWRTNQTEAQVMVQASPVGDMRRPVTVTCDPIMLSWAEEAPSRRSMHSLDRRKVTRLGLSLASVLLPRPVYSLLNDTFHRLPAGNGVRLRLCLDESLIDLPWELLYHRDATEQDSLAGFLALDPRVSIVRESSSVTPALAPSLEKERLLFASDIYRADQWVVGAREEYSALREALAPVQELLQIDVVTAADDQIEAALASPTGIFHYSGTTGLIDGRAVLSKCRDDNTTLGAETLGRLLREAGTRLAVFSADFSGRWPFVEPLLRGGLPALVAAQGVLDPKAYIAFCGKLYSSLAVGLSLDESVTSARLHVMGSAKAKNPYNWAGFMVYMPTSNAVLFPRPESPTMNARQQAVRRDREQTAQAVADALGQMPSSAPPTDKRALRQAMVMAFAPEELETLCSDVEQDLTDDGIKLQVSLALVGKEAGLEEKIRQLIDYLDRRAYLDYLVSEVRRARPKITF